MALNLMNTPAFRSLSDLSKTGSSFSSYGQEFATPSWAHPDYTLLPTKLDLEPNQYAAEKRAVTEFNNIRAEMMGLGQGEEFDEYMETRGGSADILPSGYAKERALNPIFDALSAGNYATASLVDSVITEGFTTEAFTKAAKEFGEAVSFGALDFEGTEKLTFDDVFNRNNLDFTGSSALAFVLDVFVDPINLVPTVGIAKGLGKVGAATRGKLRGTEMGQKFNTWFRPRANIEEIGQGGIDYYRQRDYIEAGINKEYFGMAERVESLVADMTPDERLLFGMFLDQPQLLKREMTVLAQKGIIGHERLANVDEMISQINNYTKGLFKREEEFGLLDHTLFRDNYLPAYTASDPKLQRGYNKLKGMRRPGSDLPGTQERARFMEQRKYETNEELFRKIQDGSIEETTLELDIHNILLRRGFEHTRWIANRKFIEGVVNNKSILPSNQGFGVGKEFSVEVELGKMGGNMAMEAPNVYKQIVDNLLKENPGKKLFEVKRRTRQIVEDKKGKKTEKYTDIIDAAYLLPADVVDHMKAGDAAFSHTDNISSFWEAVEKITSPWRAWATLSIGFHARNYIGMIWTNWLRGVGNSYDISKAWKADSALGAGENAMPSFTSGLINRHRQAMKLQRMMKGPGQLPDWMMKSDVKNAKMDDAGEFIFEGTDVDDIRKQLSGIKYEGRELTWGEIADQAQKHDVPQAITHAGPMGGQLEQMPKFAEQQAPMSKGATDEVGEAVSAAEGKVMPYDPAFAKQQTEGRFTPTTESMFDLAGQAAKSPDDWSTKLNKLLGTDNPLVTANRKHATVFENNGRLALFIDRLAKGDNFASAAAETKKWHFDYRRLSQLERGLFANFMPFYAWSRFAMPRMALSMMENPARMAKVPKMQELITNISTDNEMEQYPTPDYYDELQAINLGAFEEGILDSGGFPVYASLDLPILELNRLNMKDFASSIHPIPKLFMEEATGQSFFTGTPIEAFPGEEDKVAKAIPYYVPPILADMGIVDDESDIPNINISKSTRSVLGTLNPALERYYFRWGQDVPAKDLQGYQILRELGLNVRPLDVRRTLRGRNFEQLKMARDFARRYYQAQKED